MSRVSAHSDGLVRPYSACEFLPAGILVVLPKKNFIHRCASQGKEFPVGPCTTSIPPASFHSHSQLPTTLAIPMLSTTLLPASSNIGARFSTAMSDYTGRTWTDLVNNPLTAAIKNCHTPNAVLNILQERAQALNGSRKGDATLIRLLRPTVDCMYALSTNQALSGSASLVRSPSVWPLQLCLDTYFVLQSFMPAHIVLSGIAFLFEVCIYPICSNES